MSGIHGIRYSGSTDKGTIQLISGGSSDGNNYVGTPQGTRDFTAFGLIYITAMPAGNGYYTDPVVMCVDFGWGITMSSNFGIAVYQFIGGFPSAFVNNATGATTGWHFFCVRFNSGTGAWQVDVDNVPGTPVVQGSVSGGLTPHDVFINRNPYNAGETASADWMVVERGTYASRISDGKRDQLYAYMKATYPGAGLP